jgi:peptide deformylase
MKRKRVKAKLIIAPNPILTQVCEPVADGEDVSGKAKAMFRLLSQEMHGVGLAANQAGFTDRIIVIQNSFGMFEALVNPVIVLASPTTDISEEGCLSYPGINKQVSRHVQIDVRYQNMQGKVMALRNFSGFPARIIQHEIDHLNGKCKVGEQ